MYRMSRLSLILVLGLAGCSAGFKLDGGGEAGLVNSQAVFNQVLEAPGVLLDRDARNAASYKQTQKKAKKSGKKGINAKKSGKTGKKGKKSVKKGRKGKKSAKKKKRERNLSRKERRERNLQRREKNLQRKERRERNLQRKERKLQGKERNLQRRE